MTLVGIQHGQACLDLKSTSICISTIIRAWQNIMLPSFVRLACSCACVFSSAVDLHVTACETANGPLDVPKAPLLRKAASTLWTLPYVLSPSLLPVRTPRSRSRSSCHHCLCTMSLPVAFRSRACVKDTCTNKDDLPDSTCPLHPTPHTLGTCIKNMNAKLGLITPSPNPN